MSLGTVLLTGVGRERGIGAGLALGLAEAVVLGGPARTGQTCLRPRCFPGLLRACRDRRDGRHNSFLPVAQQLVWRRLARTPRGGGGPLLDVDFLAANQGEVAPVPHRRVSP